MSLLIFINFSSNIVDLAKILFKKKKKSKFALSYNNLLKVHYSFEYFAITCIWKKDTLFCNLKLEESPARNSSLRQYTFEKVLLCLVLFVSRDHRSAEASLLCAKRKTEKQTRFLPDWCFILKSSSIHLAVLTWSWSAHNQQSIKQWYLLIFLDSFLKI